MKFGHAYKNFLEHGGFPPEWVESAISYQKLKKCIKRVKIELASLGLDSETLQQLLDRAEKINDPDTDGERPLRFAFVNGDGDKQGQILSRRELIRPKLLFLIDEATGEPIDARLSPNTKRYIHELALSRRLTNVQLFDVADDALASIESRKSSTVSLSDTDSQRQNSGAGHKLVEVPLTSDHEFFDLLHTELCGLAHLQDQEKHKIGNEITTVGSTLVKAVEPSSKSGRADLDHWRRIFELYMDSRIFFAMGERDHGVQKFSAAQERYNKFLGEAQKTDLLRKFKRKESMIALQNFLRINQKLLQNLRFQEINQTAMIKILKKFDKRTSLNAKSIFPSSTSLTPLTLSKTLSQSLSQEITTSILSIIPSLDDYCCPICAELAWRPVRLHCKHIFCIRCLIRLQREKKAFCPLCREDVVMKADSTCLDENLVKFMKLWFPREVKAKQKGNERLALEEQFGKEFVEKADCCVM